MTKAEFHAGLVALYFVDEAMVPELGEKWPAFRDNPLWFYRTCRPEHREAIWREVRRIAFPPPIGAEP